MVSLWCVCPSVVLEAGDRLKPLIRSPLPKTLPPRPPSLLFLSHGAGTAASLRLGRPWNQMMEAGGDG